MKLYDLIKNLLVKYPFLRNSDKELIWAVWKMQGRISGTANINEYLTKQMFMSSMSTETIRRTRQKVQEQNPALQSFGVTKQAKDDKEATKGTFIFSERV